MPQSALMTPEDLFADFRSRVVGRSVRRRRLAGNSLLVYVDCEPGDETGITLWFEPTWHLRDPSSVLAGSRQAQHDAGADSPDAGFHAAADALDVLVGRPIMSLEVDPVTGDLSVTFPCGLTLTTFVSDPDTEELWHIRDNATKQRLVRTARRLEIAPSEP
jgi:hypothetical protein